MKNALGTIILSGFVLSLNCAALAQNCNSAPNTGYNAAGAQIYAQWCSLCGGRPTGNFRCDPGSHWGRREAVNPHSEPSDDGAAAAAAAEAERQRVEAVEAEKRRIDAENQRLRDEAAARQRQADFERRKAEALSGMKGIGDGELGLKDDGGRVGLKDLGDTSGGLKDVSNSTSKTAERNYKFAGNGLIGGTTWRLFANRQPGEPEKRMCDAITKQAKLAGATYNQSFDCKHYQFVLGIASSLDAFTDLKTRVAFDDLTNGRFSAQEQLLYDRLRGNRFEELGCHSNGAMICLAALENKDIKAENVILYGPQITRESLQMWDQLVRDGRVKSVKVYINENDPVPGASIAYADLNHAQKAQSSVIQKTPSVSDAVGVAAKTAANAVNDTITLAAKPAGTMATDLPLFKINVLKRTINETSPRLLVQTFPCAGRLLSTDCHDLSMYKSTVACKGKSSGQAVPGTVLHGKDALPEPPLPCGALGGKP